MNQFRIVVCFGMPKMILYKMSRAEFEYRKYFSEKMVLSKFLKMTISAAGRPDPKKLTGRRPAGLLEKI